MKEDNLKRLKKRLYKKNEAFKGRGKRPGVYGRREELPLSYWKDSGKKKKSLFRPLKIILILSSLFFLVSVTALLYLWMGESNIISSRNIEMEIRAPVSAKGGEVISFDVSVLNKNKSEIDMADIILDFPDGSFSPNGIEMKRKRYELGSIGMGGLAKKTIEMALFGKQDEEKTITATLEYRLAQSNAIFAKTVKHKIKISRPAIGVSLSIPKEVNAGQATKLKVGIVSNSSAIARGLVLRLEYPSGFHFSSAVPEPSSMNNEWRIGDLAPSQEREISVNGIVEGQDLEEKAFRATVGFENSEGKFLSYGNSVTSLVVKKPFVELDLFANGKSLDNYSALAGDSLRFEVAWKNNLTVPVRNVSIEMKILGSALNERSISVSRGFYRTFDKTLVWNSSGMPSLSTVEPGETGRARFSFSLLDPLPVKTLSDKNFVIELNGKIKGYAVMEGAEKKEIKNEISKEIKVGSRLQFANMAMHYSGSFKNTGPIPPRAGKETTYTIIWSLGNAVNDFSGVKIEAGLPSYVRWTGNVSQKDADISFDESSGKVTWNVGNIPAGTGIISPAKEISFQVALAPSVSQIGNSAVLIISPTIEERDNFTGEIFKGQKDSLTTLLQNDPGFKTGEEKVAE